MIDIVIAKKIAALLNRYIGRRLSDQEKAKNRDWEKLFKGQSKFAGPITESLKIYFYRDSILSKYIHEGFEEEEIKFLRKYLRKGDLFLDIGSNIGFFSLHAADVIGATGKVMAFEPTPRTFERLNENVCLNNLNEIIYSNNIGLSDSNGSLQLNISSDGYDAWNSFAGLTDDIHYDKQLEVPVQTLDYYIESNKIDTSKIVLIKIDVEGWEVPVIKGALNLLKQEIAPVLMVEFTEYNAFAAGSSCWELYDLVVSCGYKWFIYNAENNILIPDKKRLHYPYLNLIAVKDIEGVGRRLSIE